MLPQMLPSFNAASGNAIRATQRPISMATAFVGVSMPQAAMLYARLAVRSMPCEFYVGFNAASGNAIRATFISTKRHTGSSVFQCRKRQCYTRDAQCPEPEQPAGSVSMPQAAMLYARLDPSCCFLVWNLVSMPQAAMLYARLCLSQPANLLGPDRDFHNLPVFPSKRGYFSWTPCFQNLRKHHVTH